MTQSSFNSVKHACLWIGDFSGVSVALMSRTIYPSVEALWELVNEIHPKLAVFGLRPSFAVCRILEEPLMSGFKQCSAVMKRVNNCDTREKQLEDM